MLMKNKLFCDLCVVGGGLSGMAAAIGAARQGLRVVLMHERPMLGGNASSEIRMWISGAHGENNRETGLLEEIELENMYRNPTKSYAIWDTVLYDMVRREENIRLLLNCTCMDAETEKGEFAHGRTCRIRSVTGYQMTTQRFYEVEAEFFSDCSGDSILAPLTGAEFRIGREAAEEFGELSSTEVADKKTMGMSCMIQGRETTREIPYTPPQWSAKLTDRDFANKKPNMASDAENFWYLELGGNRDSIGDTEELRDELVALAAGTWDYIKNSGNYDVKNWDLDFLGFLPGKRESRRMCGEYMITQVDISADRVFPDEIAYGGWPLDDHFPDGFYHSSSQPNTDIPTPAPYSIPYRALYSRNVENLFFAGRNISMTHMAMSSIRVMATCALLGEAVGRAASLAVKYGCTPQDVYLEHISELQQRILEGDCFLPSKTRNISGLCKNAALKGGSEYLRNGQDRAHAIFGTTEADYCRVEKNGSVSYAFAPAKVESVHLVFSSDINRRTLAGSKVERERSMRANQRLNAPMLHMPTCLCREFRLLGTLGGETVELLHVTDNRKRCHHIQVDRELDSLTLVPMETWGEETVPVISFDFC